MYIYLLSIISLFCDFIYCMVKMFRFDHMTGENQQYNFLFHTSTGVFLYVFLYVKIFSHSITGEPSII